ncbi:MAG: GAF domain-containing protein [Planctomycetota bacterium]
MVDRPYAEIAEALPSEGTREQRMRAVADALWEALSTRGVSWVGFYVDRPGEPDDRRLELGPCQAKPACSPIGLHGVCGQAMRFRRPRIVSDVTELGDEYIACDPADRSEITVPLIDEHGACWGVLDLDSPEVAAFDETDELGLCRVLKAAGLL